MCPSLYVVFQGLMFYVVTADAAPRASVALKPHTAEMPLLAVGLVPDFGRALLPLMVVFRLVRGTVLHFPQRAYLCIFVRV